MSACAFCGRDNLAGARFCIDCGKPLRGAADADPTPPSLSAPTVPAFPASAPAGSPAMASVIPMTRITPMAAPGTARCAHCGGAVDPSLPFCAACGERVGTAPHRRTTCPRCSAEVDASSDVFCSRCGARLPGRSGAVEATRPIISLLGESGEPTTTQVMEAGELVIGRSEAELRFPDDPYMSPMHARLDLRDGQLWLRDLGSRNGTWMFITEPTRLADSDTILVGSQVLRFRRLGYPGPYPPEADATRRMGSLVPSADVAVLQQLRADGSVRDTLHLSPGRAVAIGRETGDWLFPYDQTMSGLHAEVRSEGADFFVHDLGSRNGVAIGVRGERPLEAGQRFLLGDQLLRVESL